MQNLIYKTIGYAAVFITIPLIFRLLARKYPQKDKNKLLKQGQTRDMTVFDGIGFILFLTLLLVPPLLLALPLERLQVYILQKTITTNSIYILGNGNSIMWFSFPLFAFFIPISSYGTELAVKMTQKVLSKITKRPGSTFFKALTSEKNVWNVDSKKLEKVWNRFIYFVVLPIATVFLVLGFFKYTIVQNDEIIFNSLFNTKTYSYREIVKVYRITESRDSHGKYKNVYPHFNIVFSDNTNFSTWYLHNRDSTEVDQIINYIATKAGVKITTGIMFVDVPGISTY